MNALTNLPPGGIPAAFQSANLPDMNAAAQEGLLASFAVVGYKGKNWRLRYRGEEELLTDNRGVPLPSLEVVIVGLSPAISKSFYDKRYSEGDDGAPDCYSTGGVVPDPQSPEPQSPSCAACPKNIFGSRITEAGKKAKACQDYRRLAVVPLGDIENESYGGPMLLRVPPMSLSNLAKYANDIQRFGAQPYAVATTLGFNYDVAYPELTFSPARWVTEEEAEAILEQLSNPVIERMMSPSAAEEEYGQDASPLAAGGPPASLRTPPAPPVAPQPAPAPAPTPAPAPEVVAKATTVATTAPATTQVPTKGQRGKAFAAAPEAAPPAAPASSFGGRRRAATAAAPTPQGPATDAQAGSEAEATPTPVNVVSGAPADMESAIDALLGV
jgi:hypothetical protein